MHECIGGVVFANNDVLGEPAGEGGEDNGVEWMGQLISTYPYVSLGRPLCDIHFPC